MEERTLEKKKNNKTYTRSGHYKSIKKKEFRYLMTALKKYLKTLNKKIGIQTNERESKREL